MEYLENTPNQNAVETQPVLLEVFTGKWAMYLIGGVTVFILINSVVSRVLSTPIATIVSAFPTLLLTLYVLFLVNGKLPHYKDDLFLVGLFHLAVFLYLHGWLKRPPQLWKKIRRQKPIV